MRTGRSGILAAFALVLGVAPAAESGSMQAAVPARERTVAAEDAAMIAIRDADLRVAAIAYRLAVGNAALCRTQQPVLGMPVQAIDQFPQKERVAATRVFGFEGAIVIEGVVRGSPAEIGGARGGDTIVAVNGKSMPIAGRSITVASRVAAERLLADVPLTTRIKMKVRRNGAEIDLELQPVTGCRTTMEMFLSRGWQADSSDATVRISSRFLESFGDEMVAAVLAHEFGHTVLEHEARRKAAGLKWNITAEFGRNARRWRAIEDEADRISATLLYNAGYDPRAGARFWRDHGAKIGEGGPFQSNTHSAPQARAALIEAEAAAIPEGAPRPYIPPILATRDLPLR